MKASPRAGRGTHTAGQASALYPSGSPEPFDAATDESNSELLKTQLNALFNAGPSAAVAPKCIVVGRDIDTLVNVLSQKTSLKVLKTRTLADVALIMDKILQYLKTVLYNNVTRSVPVLRIFAMGGERYVSVVLQQFVNMFSKKSQDLPKQVQFLLLPGIHFTMLRTSDRMNFFDKFIDYTARGSDLVAKAGVIEVSNSLLEDVTSYVEMPKSTCVVHLPVRFESEFKCCQVVIWFLTVSGWVLARRCCILWPVTTIQRSSCLFRS